jgi:hypothetical protein
MRSRQSVDIDTGCYTYEAIFTIDMPIQRHISRLVFLMFSPQLPLASPADAALYACRLSLSLSLK